MNPIERLTASAQGLLALAALVAGFFALSPQDPASVDAVQDPADAAPTFAALDVFVETGDRPLAGYQLAIFGFAERLVGIEGAPPEGDSPSPYAEPPHYDPRLLHDPEVRTRGRIALAALADEATPPEALPRGRVRVARLHVEVPAGDDIRNHVRRAIYLDVTFVDGDGERHRAEALVRPSR